MMKGNVLVDGIYDTYKGHAERYGISSKTIATRIGLGWSDEDAIKKPVRGKKNGTVTRF